MKKAFAFSLLAGAAMVMSPIVADAGMYSTKKVVRDIRGNLVKNTWGNCVITKWEADYNECGIDSELLTIYFAFDSSGLTPAATAKLDSLVDMLSGSNVESVDIVGFADMIGNSDYNYNLSRRRGKSVEAYLAGRGVDTRAVDVRAFGEDAPVSDCSGIKGEELKACLWRDRRVEIKLNYKQKM